MVGGGRRVRRAMSMGPVGENAHGSSDDRFETRGTGKDSTGPPDSGAMARIARAVRVEASQYAAGVADAAGEQPGSESAPRTTPRSAEHGEGIQGAVDESAVRRAPPTVRGPAPQVAPGWPSVLGVVAVSFGAIGVVSAATTVLAPIMFSGVGCLSPMHPLSGGDSWWANALWLARVVVALGLMGGGIELIRRRRRGAKLLRIIAALSLALVLIDTAIQSLLVLHPLLTWSNSQGVSPATAPPDALPIIMQLAGLVVAAILGAIFPLVLLLWLRRRASRADIDRWFTPRAAPSTPAKLP